MRIYLLISVLIALLALFVSCSGGKSNPVIPASDIITDESSLPLVEQGDAEHHLLGIWSVEFDVESLTAIVKPLRNNSWHFNVTDNVDVSYTINGWAGPNIVDVDVTILNPTNLKGYDVRLIIYDDAIGHALIEPDDWTHLWDIPEGGYYNPFIAYAKEQSEREFKGEDAHTEKNLQIYLPGGNSQVRFAVDASYPGHCEEPYEIRNFRQAPIPPVAGFSGMVYVDVLDWQNDVEKVEIYCPDLTQEDRRYPMNFSAGNAWEFRLENYQGVEIGTYPATIFATSSGLELVDKVDVVVEYVINAPLDADEYSTVELTVLGGNPELDYHWSVIEGLGKLSDPEDSEPSLRFGGVPTTRSQSTATIQCEINSGAIPLIISKEIFVNDLITTSEELIEIDYLPHNPLILESIIDDVYTFNYSQQPPPLIQTEDIIVGQGPSGGYLRKVLNVDDTGTKLIMTTTQAALGDALIDGQLLGAVDFTDERGGTIDFIADSDPLRIQLVDQVFNPQWEPGIIYKDSNVTLSFIDNSNLEFSTQLFWDYSFGFDNYLELRTDNSHFNADITIRTVVTGSYSTDDEIEIPIPRLSASGDIGPFHAEIGLFLVLGYEINASSTGVLTTGYWVDNESFSAGGRITPRVFPPGLDFWPIVIDGTITNGTREISCNIEGNADAQIYCSPTIQIDLSDALVAKLAYQPYLEAEGDFTYQPPDWCLKIFGYYGHEAFAYLKGGLCGVDSNEKWSIFADEWDLCNPQPCFEIGPCGTGQPPDQPTGVKATDHQCGYVEVSWNAVPNAVEYNIYRDTDFLNKSSSSPYIDNTAEPLVTYNYTVSAVNSSDVEGPPSELEIGWNGNPPTIPPWDPNIDASDGFYHLYVKIDFDTPFYMYNSYVIYRNDSPLVTLTGGEAVDGYEDYDAEPGVHYNYSFSILSPCGEGPRSDPDVGWCY